MDKHLGFRLEELGTGMFVNKVCYRYRTRSPGEKSVVHAHPLRKTKIKVIATAKKRRKKNKIYPVLKYKK